MMTVNSNKHGEEEGAPSSSFLLPPSSLIIVLSVGLIVGAMLRMEPVKSANDGSRWNTVWALTHGRGYVIDDAPYETLDKVYRAGHHYSSKPALMPTLIAGITWCVERATGMSLPADQYAIILPILVLVNILPFAVLLWLYARFLKRGGHSASTQLYCLLAAALGTYITAYSVSLNNHTMAACSAFFSLYCLIRILRDGKAEGRYYFLCGLFAAWTAANELIAVVFVAIAFVLLIRRSRLKTLAAFAPPVLVMAAAFFVANSLSTGKWTFDIYYLHLKDVDSSLYHYPGSYWNNPSGIDAASDPLWLYLYNFTFGHHGIFSLSPIFLISVWGMFGKDRLKAIYRAGLALTVGLLVFYTLTTTNYGGGCHGPRWFIWLIPFWLISMPPVVDRHIGSRWFRAFALVVLMVSVAAVGFALSSRGVTGFMGPWGTNWM